MDQTKTKRRNQGQIYKNIQRNQKELAKLIEF
jgi:hypothetical protein